MADQTHITDSPSVNSSQKPNQEPRTIDISNIQSTLSQDSSRISSFEVPYTF